MPYTRIAQPSPIPKFVHETSELLQHVKKLQPVLNRKPRGSLVLLSEVGNMFAVV